jgi:hypothetical protein
MNVTGTTLTYAYCSSQTSVQGAFIWAQATLNSNGTISYTTTETQVDITGYTLQSVFNPSVAMDTSSNVWVGVRVEAENAFAVMLFSGGSWALNHTFSPGGATDDIYGELLALTSGKIAAMIQDFNTGPVKTYISGWSGSAWSSLVSPASIYGPYICDACTIGDTVHFVGATGGATFSGGAAKYWNSAYPFGSTSAETALNAAILGDTVISSDGVSNLVVAYAASNQTQVVYRLSSNSGSSFGGETNMDNAVQFWSATDGINLSICPSFNGSTAFMIWEESQADGGPFGAGPWPVTFASINISPPAVTVPNYVAGAARMGSQAFRIS